MEIYLSAKIYALHLLLYSICVVAGVYEDPREEFFTHAVIKPKMHYLLKASRHQTSSQVFSEEELALEFRAFGKNFVVELKENKDLFSTKYEEIHQEDDKDVVLQNANEKQRRCYYKGRIANAESSWAAISTCNGISGVVFDGKEIYYIEPDRQSLTGQHFVFKASDRKVRNSNCGTGLLRGRVSRMQNGVNLNESANDTKYIEVIIINDNSMYKKYNSNLTEVNDRAKQVANIANTMYTPLNIVISILKVKTWSTKDLINITKDYTQTLDDFLKYRKDTLFPSEPHDNALLLTNVKFFLRVIGAAYPSGMCDSYYSGVETVDSTVAAGEVGATFAHELGHNLGMEHDDEIANCQCPEQFCIMYSKSVSVTPTKWSSCSKQALKNTFANGGGECLNNKPENLKSF